MKQNLLSTKEAARLLGVSKAFLDRDRWAGGLPNSPGARIRFIRVGARAVRYRIEDLEAYIAAQTRRSTSEA